MYFLRDYTHAIVSKYAIPTGTHSAIKKTMLSAGILLLVLKISIGAVFAQSVSNVQSTNIPTTLQLIHNAADPALDPIDIALGVQNSGGVVQQFSTILQNVYFGMNTPPVSRIGDVSVESLLGKQLAVRFNSTSGTIPAGVLYSTLPLRIGQGRNIVIAGGLLNPRRFVANPNRIPTDERLFQFIDTTSITTTANVRMLLFHGVTDAPQLDVFVRGIGKIATLYYGDGIFADIPTGDYTIDVRVSTSQTIVGTFVAPLQSLNLGGQLVTLMAAGFRASTPPSNNRAIRSQYGSPFAMMLVPTDSIAVPIQLSTLLPPVPPPTTLQVIHNSPDPSFNRMSIWAGAAVTTGSVRFIPFIPIFTFRNATQSTDAFVTVIPVPGVPPGQPGGLIREEILFGNVLGTLLAINPQVNQVRPGQTLNFNRFPGASITRGNSIVIAHGVSNLANFAPNPDTTVDRTLRLTSFTDPIDDVDTAMVRVLVFHGVTDAPPVDVVIRETGDTIATLRYGQGKFITLPPNLYTLDLVASTTEDLIGSYVLPLFEHRGQRVTVMTSGFLNSVQNRNGSPLAAVLVSPLPGRQPDILTALPLPNATAPTTLQLIHNAPDPALSPVRIWLGRPTVNNAVLQPGPGNPNNPNQNNTATTVTTYTTLVPSFRYRTGTLAASGLGDAIPFFKDIISVNLNLNLTTTASRTATTAILSTPFTIGRGANILIASGLQRQRNFAANPDGLSTSQRILQFVDSFRLITTDIVRILAVHNVSDAPTLEFVARGNFPMITTIATTTTLGTTTIQTITVFTAATVRLAELKYGEGGFATLPTGDYAIDIRANVGLVRSTIASYTATFATMSLGGQRVTLAASGFLNENAPNQAAGPMQMLAVVNTVFPLNATMNTVTLATTTTGTMVEIITTTTVAMPHSFLLPMQMYPRSVGVGLAKSLDSETNVQAQGDEVQAGNALQKHELETIDEAEKSHQTLHLETYPNPTTEEVSIRYMLKKAGDVRVSLYDAFGQAITHFSPLRQDTGEQILQLDMSALPRGAYQILITTPSGTNRAKVMVVR